MNALPWILYFPLLYLSSILHGLIYLLIAPFHPSFYNPRAPYLMLVTWGFLLLSMVTFARLIYSANKTAKPHMRRDKLRRTGMVFLIIGALTLAFSATWRAGLLDRDLVDENEIVLQYSPFSPSMIGPSDILSLSWNRDKHVKRSMDIFGVAAWGGTNILLFLIAREILVFIGIIEPKTKKQSPKSHESLLHRK